MACGSPGRDAAHNRATGNTTLPAVVRMYARRERGMLTFQAASITPSSRQARTGSILGASTGIAVRQRRHSTSQSPPSTQHDYGPVRPARKIPRLSSWHAMPVRMHSGPCQDRHGAHRHVPQQGAHRAAE